MKNTHICPKCGSQNIARVPDNPNPCAREFFAFLSGYQKEEEPGEGAAAGAAPPAKEN